MPILSVRHLKKSFGGVHAVRGVSFDVDAGKVTAIIGPNGAGKTTVFGLVSGLVTPDAGSVHFAGVDVTKQAAWQRARLGLSRTFQLARTFRNLSIEENLLLAVREDDDLVWRMLLRGSRVDETQRTAVRDMLKFVGLEKDPKSPVTDLSYGQQKLFDLARALLKPHTLLMLDEPVAGVNPVLRDTLAETLCTLRDKGESILLIEHDMGFVRRVADRVIVMAEGVTIADGTPDDVFAHKDVLEAYLGVNIPVIARSPTTKQSRLT